jgi:hypothetical protein
MLRSLIIVSVFGLFICGCAVDEAVKQNAYLHNKTVEMTKAVAGGEGVSNELDGLISLSSLQSRAFVADYGLPDTLPAASTIDDILSESSFALADSAFNISQKKADAWDVADGLINAGLTIAGLFGGVWGIKAASYLRSAQLKSNALREVVLGNEVFKKTNGEMTPAFKTAHVHQSQPTRKIVKEMKE